MGNSLAAPITTQHVERHFVNLFNAAAIDVNGWRDGQEDAHTIRESINSNGIMLIGVYDGHGGEKAARFVEESIETYFAPIDSIDDNEDNLEKIVQVCLDMDHHFINEKDLDDGCTACIVLGQPWDLVEDKPIPHALAEPLSYEQRDKIGVKLLVVNIGDSRAIIVKPNGETVQCTEDHKPQDPVERARIVSAGGVVQNARVDGTLALSRAFGDRNYKNNPNVSVRDQKVICVPDFSTFIMTYGDILSVCCDGIYESEAMDEHEVVGTKIHEKRMELLKPFIEMEKTAKEGQASDEQPESDYLHLQYLIDPALISRHLIEQSIFHGSRDNHTAITVCLSPHPQFPPLCPQLDAALKRAQDLLRTQIVPGLIPPQNGNNNDFQLYRTDMGPETYNENQQFIQQVHQYTQSRVQGRNGSFIVDFTDFPLRDQFSVPPMVIHTVQNNNGPQQQLLQMLLASSGMMADQDLDR